MKIFKVKNVAVILTGMIFFLALTVQGNEQQDIELLIQSFHKTEAQLDTYWLHFGFPYEEYRSDDLLLLTGNRLSSTLMLPEMTDLVKINQQKIYLNQGTWGKGTEVTIQIKRKSEQSKEMYLVFRLEGNRSLDDFRTFYKLLYSKMQEIQFPPKINSCIQGNINDKLENEEQDVLIDDILNHLNAKVVEKLDTDLVKSVSAYSPLMKYSIWTGNNKMNIQVATHVNNLEEKTVLTLGTPIITIEY